MNKILYVNGDSYSAPLDHKVYGDILASKYNVKIVNKAVRGSSNNRIIRATLEDCVKFKRQSFLPYVIIGLSFVTREEVWAPTADYELIKRFNDHPEGKFVTLDSIIANKLTDLQKNKIIDSNINTQMVNLFVDVYMLTNTLDYLGIPHFIFSAANNQSFKELNFAYLMQLEMYKEIGKKENILDLLNFNIPLWAKKNSSPATETGHLANIGSHAYFAEYLHTNHLSNLVNWDLHDIQ